MKGMGDLMGSTNKNTFKDFGEQYYIDDAKKNIADDIVSNVKNSKSDGFKKRFYPYDDFDNDPSSLLLLEAPVAKDYYKIMIRSVKNDPTGPVGFHVEMAARQNPEDYGVEQLLKKLQGTYEDKHYTSLGVEKDELGTGYYVTGFRDPSSAMTASLNFANAAMYLNELKWSDGGRSGGYISLHHDDGTPVFNISLVAVDAMSYERSHALTGADHGKKEMVMSLAGVPDSEYVSAAAKTPDEYIPIHEPEPAIIDPIPENPAPSVTFSRNDITGVNAEKTSAVEAETEQERPMMDLDY